MAAGDHRPRLPLGVVVELRAYAVFLHRTGRKVSELLVRRLKEDIDEYNGEHPGDAVEARIISVTRGREESPADFVCRMADEIWK